MPIPSDKTDHPISVKLPVLSALLVCDMVIREMQTGKISLINIFSTIFAPQIPYHMPSMWVFISLVDGHGPSTCQLQIVNLKTGEILVKMDGDFEFRDPLSVLELVFRMDLIRFNELGMYSIDFYVNKILLGSKRIQVQRV